MITKQLAELVLQRAVSTGGDFAEIFLEDRISNNILVRNGITETLKKARIHGAGIRVYLGLKSYYVFTNDTTENGLLNCAAKAAACVKSESLYNITQLEQLRNVSNLDEILKQRDISAKKKIDLLKAMNKSAKTVDTISQVIANYSDSEQHVWIANSEGRFVADTRVYSRINFSTVASNGTETQSSHSGPGASRGFEFFNTIDLNEIAIDTARTSSLMLTAPYCPAGKMPVVIGNGFGGVIFHEACGHSLEASAVAYNNSEFAGKLGQKIASDCVTAVDDGTIPFAWGSENVDDEGTPTTNLTLIENGILKNYMIDRFNNRRLNMELTGSARRESYKYAPTSRMRNTYIANGTDNEEEMISTMGDGLYAARMGGGSVNPATGDFNFAVEEGYLVKGGKIVHPVRGAALIGKGSDILMQIDRVGNNLKQAQGMCGSSSGSVPTNVGQPYIRVKEITVGGKSE